MKSEDAAVPVTLESVSTAVEETPEPEETLPEAEPDPTPAPELTTAPASEPPKAAVTPTPKAKAAEPEYFYEDGKRYAYVNGIKTYIAPDNEPAVNQVEFYDWENDPAGQIRGPFN